MASYAKPLPIIDEANGYYWKACKQDKLVIQKCRSCGSLQTFPRKVCYKCLSDSMEWIDASGKGTVYSHTTIYHAPTPEFRDDVPYTIVIVDLEEGIRMMGTIVNCTPQDIKIGMTVEVIFDHVSEDFALPRFRPFKLSK